MAKSDKEKKKDVVLEEVTEEKLETSENIEVPAAEAEPTPKPEPPKPYIHVDQFLRSARQLYNLNSMQVAGFKARMNGRQYQRDVQVFVDELKQYLNLK